MKWIILVFLSCASGVAYSAGPLESLVIALHNITCSGIKKKDHDGLPIASTIDQYGEKTTWSTVWCTKDQNHVLQKKQLIIQTNDRERTVAIESIEEKPKGGSKSFFNSSGRTTAFKFENCSPKKIVNLAIADYSLQGMQSIFKGNFWSEKDRPLSWYEHYLLNLQ